MLERAVDLAALPTSAVAMSFPAGARGGAVLVEKGLRGDPVMVEPLTGMVGPPKNPDTTAVLVAFTGEDPF